MRSTTRLPQDESMKRRRSPRPIAEPLELLTSRLAPATLLAEVQSVWPKAVGEGFAAYGQPVSERDGVVTVGCVSAVYAHDLSLMTDQTLAAVNAALGRPAVRKLRFTARAPSR